MSSYVQPNDDLCDHHLLSDSVLKQGTFLLRKTVFFVASIKCRASSIAVLRSSLALFIARFGTGARDKSI